MSLDNRYKRLGKNTLTVFMGSAGSKIITLIMLPYYTRILSTVDYGISDLIMTYASIMVSVVSCCIADSILVFPKNTGYYNKKKYFTSGLVFSFLSYVLWAVITSIVNCMDGCGTMSNYAWWIYAITISYAIQGYFQQFNLSIDKIIVYSTTGIVQVACMALLAFVLMPSYGLHGYLLSIIISNFLSAVYAAVVSKLYTFFNIRLIDKFHLTELLKYGVPLIPNTIMWWIVNGINRPIMEVNLGFDAIGIYAVANKLPAVITMLFGVFSSAWSVTLLEEFGKADFNSFFNRTMKMIFLGISIFTILFILSSRIIVKIFAAPNFFDAWYYVPILSVGVLLSCVSGLIGGIFTAEKKSKYFFYSSIWGAVSSLIFTIIGVKLMGLMGVCLAVVFSFFVMALVRLRYAWEHINMFSVSYYISMFLLVSVVSTVMLLSESMVYSLLTGTISLSIMILINRHELRDIYQYVSTRVKI